MNQTLPNYLIFEPVFSVYLQEIRGVHLRTFQISATLKKQLKKIGNPTNILLRFNQNFAEIKFWVNHLSHLPSGKLI